MTIVTIEELDRDSPRYLFGFLLAAIFAAEGFIMLGFHFVAFPSPVVEGLANGALLTLVLFPLVYFQVFRNLRDKNLQVHLAEGRLREANAVLERRVAERTGELARANEGLESTLAQLRAKQRNLVALRDLGRFLHACKDEAEAHRVGAQRLTELIPNCAGALYLTKASRNVLTRILRWPEGADWPEHFTPEECWSLRLGRPYAGDGASPTTRCEHAIPGDPAHSRFCLPLVARGEILGVLCLAANAPRAADDERGIPADDSEELYSAVAETMALVMANLQLRKTLETQAFHDQLTGLYNRHFLAKQLEIELHKCERSGAPLSVVIFDIDRFKSFNDLHGHEAGDLVLAAIGRVAMDAVRVSDIACRYGGEEFVILMPGAPEEVAAKRAGVLLNKVRALALQHKGAPLGPVTVSAGVATFRKHAGTAEGLLRAADAALYRAKDSGRDRVCVAEEAAAAAVRAVGD